MTETHVNKQFQTKVVTTVVQRKFVVHMGQCGTCHERVQGRHLPRAARADPRTKNQLQFLPAANDLGEPAIRPAVVNRKVWGGNRTDRGAAAPSTLSTIVLTAWQRTLDPLAWLQRLRQSPIDLLLPRPRR